MDFRDTQGEAMTDTIDATVAAEAPAAEANGGSKAIHARPYPVEVDHSRDALLTDFGKETLNDRYLLPGEKPDNEPYPVPQTPPAPTTNGNGS